MLVTMREVRQRLTGADVDFDAATELGPDALPHLAELATTDDTVLACKAIYLASRIGGSGGTEIITRAAGHDDPIVRIAASAALRNLEHAR
ncbi:hypothetical protein V5P93_001495 [Actinokineospora auranticolor]|uniref:HEAT repeat protein n=1 Tax=Actinokineospora auranticolor TaxID=155976 RepID=A0A2S6GVA0_9PSEU|nr:hypothetical protein [Actinokineospora auranticolor]PPK69119.1 hypothetical protein CLV40_104370 [Actinokineospora auranticolor]